MNRNKKEVQPHWRPNFVNPGELPDIKVIRTDFIINIVALVLMLLAGFFVLQREYRSYALGKTVDGMEQQIRVSEADDNLNLKLSEEFKNKAAHVVELEKFFLSPVLAHEFLGKISEMRPEELVFEQVSFMERSRKEGPSNIIFYQVNIVGDVRSLTILDEFKGLLEESEILATEGYKLEIDEALQGRDAETGIFPYTLEITLTPAKGTPNQG